MAKSKPIGVRFDLEKLELIQKEQNLNSAQAVLNYLMDNYGLSNQVKRGAPFKNMPPYNTDSPKLEELSNFLPTPPKNLKGLDLAIWKSENWK
jgi:hypothetical protein